jgi:tetratricopeptide (TPR) repeat protein
VAQALRLPETLIRALQAKSQIAVASGRPEEELALRRHALRHALEHDLLDAAGTAYGNLSDACFRGDRYAEALDALTEALALARRIGDRQTELYVLAETSYALSMSGRWQEALAVHSELPEEQLRTYLSLTSTLSGVLEILIHRGRVSDSRALFSLFDYVKGVPDLQDQAIYQGARAALLHAEGRYDDALEAGSEAARLGSRLGAGQQGVKQGLVWAVEAALAQGERERANDLLGTVETLPPGLRPPFLEAQAQRFRARMDGDESGFKTAAGVFREYNFPFWLAVTEVEHGEWLAEEGRVAEAEPLFAEAREIFERLEATPWLDRLDRATDATAVAASGAPD